MKIKDGYFCVLAARGRVGIFAYLLVLTLAIGLNRNGL
jgi:hypothetical protein